MNTDRLLLVIVLVGLAGYLAWAGPLSPPAGPVSSTFKTLAEVEPRIALSQATTPGDASSVFVISEPGSYYATGPLPAEGGKHGITIAASGVTLDLGGFAHEGDTTTLSAVRTFGNRDGVVVRNGIVSGWGSFGVSLTGSGHRVESVIARENGVSGIGVGSESSVVDSAAIDNGSGGISGALSATVTRCTSTGNGTDGISTGSGGRVTDCTVSENDNEGIEMINGLVSGCVVRDNARVGIVARDGIVESCTVIDNGSHGIATSSPNFFNVTQRAVIRDNYVEGNAVGTSDAGIFVATQTTTIEGNTLIANAFGIRVTRTNGNNLVINNRAFENTANYSIVAGNPLGPIVSITNASNLSAVVNADHPLANLSR